MSEELRKFTEVDRVIHEPARLLIVNILYVVEKADFLYLLHETGLTKGNLSAHLSKLENARYVTIEKTFRGKIPQTLIALNATGRVAFETYRKQLTEIVSQISEDRK
jgi:DNA-binding transcriptional ArsR family regulator